MIFFSFMAAEVAKVQRQETQVKVQAKAQKQLYFKHS